MTCLPVHSKQNIAVLSIYCNRAPRRKAGSALRWLMRLLDRANQRNDLSELSDGQLADIGVTRREAEREAGKWLWE
jgi:uncharacterized protein YjiS (DUF1127 family)